MADARHDLYDKFLRGEASDLERAELKHLLETDSRAPSELFSAAEVERDLRELLKPERRRASTGSTAELAAIAESNAHRPGSGRALRRKRKFQTRSPEFAIPAAVAALAVIAILLFAASSGRRSTPLVSTAPHTQQNTSAESAAQAEAAVRRREAERQRIQRELAQAEARQKEIIAQLERVERERQKIVQTAPAVPAVTENVTAEEQERKAALDRIDAERRRIEAELAESHGTRKQAKEQLAKVDAADPGTAPKPPLQAALLGRLTQTSGAFVLLRQGAPVAAGAESELRAGDRLTFAPRSDFSGSAGTLLLDSGVAMDVQAGTELELSSLEHIKLRSGRIYSDVKFKSAANKAGIYRLVVSTAAADVTIEGTRFDIRADGDLAHLRMEEGRTLFSNAHGQQRVSAFYESIARKNAAPSVPRPIQPESLWRGRKETVRIAVASFSLINTETNDVIPGFESVSDGVLIDIARLPTRKISLRANTIPETVGSVRFDLNGMNNYKLESVFPYAMTGDTNVKYKAWEPRPGEHHLVATPFTEASGKGQTGLPLEIRFTIKDDAAKNRNDE
ncbi:MAG TPA: FecR domain-containing protein [Planctomycetota bacterium]|nr:FecR domain-containing protein [Planctomycetota bacterium]